MTDSASTFEPSEGMTDERAHNGFRYRVTSYKMGDKYVAVADNIDPGAVIARASGDSREGAVAQVLLDAEKRLDRTRTHGE